MRPSIWLSVVAYAGFAAVQTFGLASAATPFEPWKDPCNYPGIPPEAMPGVQRLLGAEAMLVPVGMIAKNSDDPNFWHFTNTQSFYQYPGTNELIFSGPFLFETRMAPRGRSGYLVAPDILVTASHTNIYRPETFFNPSDYVVVFNMHSGARDQNGACTAPNPAKIPDADVYVVPPGTQYWDFPLLESSNVDYAAFRLPREVPGRRHIRLRRSGEPSPNDVLALVSHPAMLRAKMHYGVQLENVRTNPNPGSYPVPHIFPTYVLEGSSGGPLFNITRGFVEASVASHFSCVRKEYLPNSTSMNLVDTCDGEHTPFPPNPINWGPIELVAVSLPTPEIRTSPLNDVTYVIPGMSSAQATTYAIKASPDATGTTSTMAWVDPAPTGQPQLLEATTVFGNLAPGASTSLLATAQVPSSSLPCGTYDRFVHVADVTNTFYDVMRHRFEVRLTEFDVTPQGGNRLEAVAAPSVPSQLTYRVSNSRLTPVTVTVAAQEPWLLLNGQTLPVSLSLGIKGDPNDHADVVVSLATSAFALSDGSNPFHLRFTNVSNCPVLPEIVEEGEFLKGQVTISAGTGPVEIPHPTPNSSPFRSTLIVPETFCMSDMRLEMDMALDLPGLPYGIPLADLAPHLRAAIATDSGSTLFWNHDAVPAGWMVPTYVDKYLFFVDQSTNEAPQGPGLSLFNGSNPAGQWHLTIWDDRPSSDSRAAALWDWRVVIKGTAGSCP